jgi:hypothetical protein
LISNRCCPVSTNDASTLALPASSESSLNDTLACPPKVNFCPRSCHWRVMIAEEGLGAVFRLGHLLWLLLFYGQLLNHRFHSFSCSLGPFPRHRMTK